MVMLFCDPERVSRYTKGGEYAGGIEGMDDAAVKIVVMQARI